MVTATDQNWYPVQFSVDYPDRPLNRLTTFFRIFTVIPIAVVLAAVSGQTWQSSTDSKVVIAGAGGLLFVGPLLMILFRLKYPRWRFGCTHGLRRFGERGGISVLLMDDRCPWTDEHQSVHLDYRYPQMPADRNQF